MSTESEVAGTMQQEAAAEQQKQSTPPAKKRFEVDIYNKIVSGEGPMEQTHLEKVHYDKPVIIEATSEKDLKDFAEKLAIC